MGCGNSKHGAPTADCERSPQKRNQEHVAEDVTDEDSPVLPPTSRDKEFPETVKAAEAEDYLSRHTLETDVSQGGSLAVEQNDTIEKHDMYRQYKKDLTSPVLQGNNEVSSKAKTAKFVKQSKVIPSREERPEVCGKVAEEASAVGKCDVEYPLLANVVRIFTSSTFTDTRSERNALMDRVYPQLKEFCQERGYDFQVVDMRWGVRDEATDDHMTSELCMREIENCQRVSTGPNFVTFLGQKYGYRPFPPKIAADEFEAILTMVDNKDDRDLMSEWFQRDDNLQPPYYLLQPIRDKLPDYSNEKEPDKKKEARAEWWDVFERLQTVLREASLKTMEHKEDAHKYFWAVTEDEIHNGILKARNLPDTTFWFHRTIVDVEENLSAKTARRFIDMKGKELDTEALNLLSKLREDVSDILPKNSVKSYEVHWKDPGIDPTVSEEHRAYIDRFCMDFKDTLETMITNGIEKRKQSMVGSSEYEEYIAHLQLAQKKADVFHGRSDLIEKIKSKLVKEDGKPIVLMGAAGSGKTSLIAMVTTQVRTWLEEVPVIVRFLGTTTRSSNTRDLLSSLTKQLANEMSQSEEEADMPTTFRDLAKHFQDQLATISTPMCIILDSLDQLRDKGCNLRDWIPETLNSNVSLVLSTITNEESEICDNLKGFLSKDCFLAVPLLRPEDTGTIFNEWFKTEGRTLAKEQMSLLQAICQEVKLPLFCKIAFDQACRWKSYTPIDQCHLGKTVTDVINDRFEILEKYHGKTLVRHTLSYITSAKSGLSSAEVEDILSLDDVALNDVYQYHTPPLRRLPPLLVVRIQADVKEFLVSSGADGVQVMRWYHGQFHQVATKRYLSDPNFRKSIHESLVDFFLGKWSGGVSKSYTDRKGQRLSAERFVAKQPLKFSDGDRTGIYNLRKMNELPYHIVKGGDLQELKEHVFMNFDWLYNKIKAIGVDGILDDYVMAFDHGMMDSELETFGKALELSRRAVMFDVHQLPLQLWGRLGQIDFQQNPYIQKLLQHSQKAPFSCLISTQGFMAERDSQMNMRIAGHEARVEAFTIRDDFKEMLTCSGDQTVRLWDLSNGRETKRIPLDPSEACLPQSYTPLVNIHYCNMNMAAVIVFGTFNYKVDLERETFAGTWQIDEESHNVLALSYPIGDNVYTVLNKDIQVLDIATWKKISEIEVPHMVDGIDPGHEQKLKNFMSGHKDQLVFHRGGMSTVQIIDTETKEITNVSIVDKEEAKTVIVRLTTTISGRLVGYILRSDNNPMMTYTGEFVIIDILSRMIIKRISDVQSGAFLTFEIIFSMDDKTVIFTRHPGGHCELAECNLETEKITTFINLGFTYINNGLATPDGRIFFTYMTDGSTVEGLDYRKLSKASGTDQTGVVLDSPPMNIREPLSGGRFHSYDTIDGKLGIWDLLRKRAVRQGYSPGAAMFLQWIDEERMVGMGYTKDSEPLLQVYNAATGDCLLKSGIKPYKPLNSVSRVWVIDKDHVLIHGPKVHQITTIHIGTDTIVDTIDASDKLTRADELGDFLLSENKRFAICFKMTDPSKPDLGPKSVSNIYVFDLKMKTFTGDMPIRTSATLGGLSITHNHAVFTPDGDTYITILYTEGGSAWGGAHLPTRKWRKVSNPPASFPSSLGFSSALNAVVVAYSGKHIIAYDVKTFEPSREIQTGFTTNMVISPNGNFAAIKPNEATSRITIVDLVKSRIFGHYQSDTESSGFGWTSDSHCLLVAVKGINHLVQFLLHEDDDREAEAEMNLSLQDEEYLRKIAQFKDIFGEPKESNYMAGYD